MEQKENALTQYQSSIFTSSNRDKIHKRQGKYIEKQVKWTAV